MNTYNRNESFALRLNAASSDRVITVWETRQSEADAAYLRDAEHVIINGFIKNFRVKSQLSSIAEINLPNLSVEQSRTERLNAVRNIEWQSPRKHLKLYFASNSNDWHHIATVSLLNVPPYRLINLMEYFTPNIALELGATGAIGVSMENAGYGLLSGSDELVVYGSATTEVVVIPTEIPPLQNCTPYGWTISTDSQPILPAMNGRKQITLVNLGEGEIYLNIGDDAYVGQGIALMPNGGSYEFNRSNHPVNLPIHAIATEPTELSGLVCV